MADVDGTWTLAELVERAASALGEVDVRAPNGRVTEIPDARMIRWYATTGLLDRPLVRGRVARYGSRHLLQLVAIKRLQAQGLRLAEIQRRLAGAPEATLRRIAALPAQPAPATATAATTTATATATSTAAATATVAADTAGAAPPGRDARFWTSPPPAETLPGETLPVETLPGETPVADPGAHRGAGAGESDTVEVRYVLRLGGAAVLLSAPPQPGDLPAIREAARPLLDALAAHGLLSTAPLGHPPEQAPPREQAA